MAKLVICRSIRFPGDCKTALEKIKLSTARGFKKYWKRSISGGYVACAKIEKYYNKKYAFLLWEGSDERYMIIKLTDDTNTIVKQVDIDINDKIWNKINFLQDKLWVHYDDMKKYTFSEKFYEEDNENIFQEYLKILEPIKKDLF